MSKMAAASNAPLYAVVFTVTFFGFWITTMAYSFLPKLVHWFGVATLDVGLHVGVLGTSMYVGAFLSSPVWGYLTDELGHRPCVYLTSAFCLVTTVSQYFCRGHHISNLNFTLHYYL